MESRARRPWSYGSLNRGGCRRYAVHSTGSSSQPRQGERAMGSTKLEPSRWLFTVPSARLPIRPIVHTPPVSYVEHGILGRESADVAADAGELQAVNSCGSASTVVPSRA
ncbi:hypothetical protein MRX96_007663 [Rhipicephalus microplus]